MRHNLMCVLAALGAGVGLVTPDARAQAPQYPDRPVKIVVPFAAGGGVDALARVLAQKLQERGPHAVVVENRAGSNGTVGGLHVMQSQPDGATLLFSASTHVMAKLVMSKAPYDPVADFTAVARVGEAPLLIVISPKVAATTLKEVIADIKANPTAWTAGTAALGSPGHVASIAFGRLAGVKLRVLPYRGTAPALNDVAGGHIQMLIDAMVALLPMANSGNVKGVVITSSKRSQIAPNIPTAAEAGMPGLDISSWYALWGPKGMPGDLVQRINLAVGEATRALAGEGRLEKLGVEAVSETPAQFAQFIEREVKGAAELLASADFKPE
jgi:tripartite-type tricarboxylate transporter receptor subunit TctC